MARAGRMFEESVCVFYRALDPNAQVLFDHRVPDADTGRPRQVDVWVVCRLLGNLVLQVLVSCKDHRRPLDVGEVEQFAQEIRSTRATNGVLYGRGGFTEGALAKARAMGISCCRLFDDAPPEHPTEQLLETYVAAPVHRVLAEMRAKDWPEGLPWHVVLSSPIELGTVRTTIAEAVGGLCAALVCRSEERPTSPEAPRPADLVATLDVPAGPMFPPFRWHVAMTWSWYRARLDVLRLTGSLNATNGEFVGRVRVGPIPMQTFMPVDRWEPCVPPTTADPRGRIVVSALAWPVGSTMLHALGSSAFGPGIWAFGPPGPSDIPRLLAGSHGVMDGVVDAVQIIAEFRPQSRPAV